MARQPKNDMPPPVQSPEPEMVPEVQDAAEMPQVELVDQESSQEVEMPKAEFIEKMASELKEEAKVEEEKPKPVEEKPFQVVALRKGFYKKCRYNEGDKFMVDSKSHLGSWMKKI